MKQYLEADPETVRYLVALLQGVIAILDLTRTQSLPQAVKVIRRWAAQQEADNG